MLTFGIDNTHCKQQAAQGLSFGCGIAWLRDIFLIGLMHCHCCFDL